MLRTLANGVYMFGFIAMTPQLYINYRCEDANVAKTRRQLRRSREIEQHMPRILSSPTHAPPDRILSFFIFFNHVVFLVFFNPTS